MKKNADLVAIGAYKAGSNRKLDFALSKIDAVNGFLTQGVDESFSYEACIRQIEGNFEVSIRKEGAACEKNFQFSRGEGCSPINNKNRRRLRSEHAEILALVRAQEPW